VRQLALGGFLATIPPLIWMYYRHSVQRIPGAYTHYSFFEWSLVFWDVSFDSIAMTELSHLRVSNPRKDPRRADSRSPCSTQLEPKRTPSRPTQQGGFNFTEGR